MRKYINNPVDRFRVIAFCEGVSLLIILFITMPLKYLFDTPQPNYLVGMLHGILFITYVIGVVYMKYLLKFNLKTTFLLLLASIIPFGTFWTDKKILMRYI